MTPKKGVELRHVCGMRIFSNCVLVRAIVPELIDLTVCRGRMRASHGVQKVMQDLSESRN